MEHCALPTGNRVRAGRSLSLPVSVTVCVPDSASGIDIVSVSDSVVVLTRRRVGSVSRTVCQWQWEAMDRLPASPPSSPPRPERGLGKQLSIHGAMQEIQSTVRHGPTHHDAA